MNRRRCEGKSVKMIAEHLREWASWNASTSEDGLLHSLVVPKVVVRQCGAHPHEQRIQAFWVHLKEFLPHLMGCRRRSFRGILHAGTPRVHSDAGVSPVLKGEWLGFGGSRRSSERLKLVNKPVGQLVIPGG